VMREHLPNCCGNRPAAFFGNGLRVIETLGPSLDAGIPHDEPRDHWAGQGPTAHLVTADDARGTLGHQPVFELERGLYSGDREGSLDSIPSNVSG